MEITSKFGALLCLILLFSYQIANAQNALSEKIAQHTLQIQNAERFEPLQEVVTDELKSQVPDNLLAKKQFFQILPDQVNTIKTTQSEHLRLSIPIEGQATELHLIKANILKDGFKIVAASDPKLPLEIDTGLHYWGKIEGQEKSLVAVSFFDNEITATISLANAQYTLGKMKQSDKHILYKNSDLAFSPDLDCSVIPVNDTDLITDSAPVEKSDVNDCVRTHLEIDYSVYVSAGSNYNTTASYITGLFSQVALMYANESIDIGISYLNIWDTPSPYADTTLLDDLTAQGYGRTHGDIVHLIHTYGGGGVAYLDILCNSTVNTGVSGIYGSYQNVPTYSWDVNVITHEIGHNLGSRHTHACVWNGNSTQIDDCGNKYFDEDGDPSTNPPSCYDANNQILPANGGTIMSYCHLISGVGVNFNEGFGTQPGDLIRNRVNAASCLIACSTGPTCNDGQQNGNETDTDCGGPDCAPCPTCTDGVLNGGEAGIDCGGTGCAACDCSDKLGLIIIINTDNYANETTWRITDGTGNILYAAGGPYPMGVQTIVETPCLPAGCYNFAIFDSYGDGLFDGTTTGSYTVADTDGNVLASGAGNFGSSQNTNICLTPSCSDVDLSIKFDENPQETSWVLVSVADGAIASGGPYNLQPENSTRIERFCLDDGCYYILFSDSGGDGMCSDENTDVFIINTPLGGSGSGGKNNTGDGFGSSSPITLTAADSQSPTSICGTYKIIGVDGSVIVSGGGNFGSSQNTAFCVTGGVATLQHSTDNEAYMRQLPTELSYSASMQIFPTLAQHNITITHDFDIEQITQMTVFDVNGNIVLQQNLNANTTQLPISDLSAGIYFAQLVNGDVMMTEKFVKK